MKGPKDRDDISNFVVHLTRRYGNDSARHNLVSILNDRTIEARHPHCLFSPLFSQLRFTDLLKSKFKTVCFTETPVNQITPLCRKIPGRQIELEPYGLVFYRDYLLERGGSPAFYINSDGTEIRDYLIEQFREHFNGIRSLRNFKRRQRRRHEQIIQYYSFINKMGQRYDFSWEREWRFAGDLSFKYEDVVAVIAKLPLRLKTEIKKQIRGPRARSVRKLPIISPDWGYERIVDELSRQVWNLQS
jgi:hypothetical protein